MGKDAQVRAAFPDGVDEGRLQYEPPTLLFRGARRRVFQGDGLKGVRAEADDLVLADGSRFTLGRKAAANWAASWRSTVFSQKPSGRGVVSGF